MPLVEKGDQRWRGLWIFLAFFILTSTKSSADSLNLNAEEKRRFSGTKTHRNSQPPGSIPCNRWVSDRRWWSTRSWWTYRLLQACRLLLVLISQRISNNGCLKISQPSLRKPKVAVSDETIEEIRGANWPENQALVFPHFLRPHCGWPLALSGADSLASEVQMESILLGAQGFSAQVRQENQTGI